MKRVTKKLPLVVAVATALSLSFVTVHQSGVIQGLKKTLGITEAKLDKSEKALAAERELTTTLQEEKQILEDSINVLNTEVAQLNEKVADLKATIRYQNQKIQKLEDNVKALTKQISAIKGKRKADIDKIKELEAEREQVLIRMEELDRERILIQRAKEKAERQKREENRRIIEVQKQKEEVENKISRPTPTPDKPTPSPQPQASASTSVEIRDEVNAEVKTLEQERIRKILTGTTVNFMAVKLSMKENGKPLDKLKKDGWKSTLIEVDLKNADHEAIIDEEFIVQVFDLDNNKVVPVNEANVQYPDSHQGSLGYKFSYDGQPLKINYFNSQKKTGRNFELRLFYAKSGVLLPLKSGTLRFVKDGTVI